MPIKASSARQITSLIIDLKSESAAARENAAARLTVMGARAVEPLLLLLDSDASGAARGAALRVLEAIGDFRAIDGVAKALDAQDPDVATVAASAARAFLRAPRGTVVVDRLTAAALDTNRDERVRVAALQALRELEHPTIAPLLDALRQDKSAAVRAVTKGSESLAPAEVIMAAAERALPDDPDDLWNAVTLAGTTIALPILLRVIKRLRSQEASEPASRRAAWARVRGHVHLALATRGSRIALYDLRESLEAASTPLPVEFLAALSTAGDATCVEALASAYARAMPRSKRPEAMDDNAWWRDRLGETIVSREGLTGRHGAIKRIRKRWPAILRGA